MRCQDDGKPKRICHCCAILAHKFHLFAKCVWDQDSGLRTQDFNSPPLMGRAMCLDAIDCHPAGMSRWAIQIALHDFLTLAFNSNYPVVDCLVLAEAFCAVLNRTQDRGVICLLSCAENTAPHL